MGDRCGAARVLVIAVGGHWLRHPTVARSHARNPQMAHFYGAAPMAFLTVGAGAILVGRDLIGERIAVDLDWVLWTAGTPRACSPPSSIPFLMFTQHNVEPDAAFGGWLMPVVPPMVSAATGALLIPHMAPGTGRETMLYGCYAMFGRSRGRVADHHHDDLDPTHLVRHIGYRAGADTVDRARPARPIHHGRRASRDPTPRWPSIPRSPRYERVRDPLRSAGLGVRGALDFVGHVADRPDPAPGNAVRADVVEPDVPRRDVRHRDNQLALHTGLPALRVAAVIAYVGLLFTWVLVAIRSARGSLRGNLFTRPAPTR